MHVNSDWKNFFMHTIDINCDMGEGGGGGGGGAIDNDAGLMRYISSANIACGFHAGDESIMQQTVELALRHNVAIGAHPSFYDKENFGRTEMQLSPNDIYDIVLLQLRALDKVVREKNARLHHVKPHGALYNMSAKSQEIAAAIACAVKDFDPRLILFGLCNSYSIVEAGAFNLKSAAEAFADRTYQDNGMLTPRSQDGALISDSKKVVEQVLQIIKQKSVNSISGKKISMEAKTICIHGDGAHAAQFARAINGSLKENNIVIEAIQ
jgi:UPF0271 protein